MTEYPFSKDWERVSVVARHMKMTPRGALYRIEQINDPRLIRRASPRGPKEINARLLWQMWQGSAADEGEVATLCAELDALKRRFDAFVEVARQRDKRLIEVEKRLGVVKNTTKPEAVRRKSIDTRTRLQQGMLCFGE